MKLIRNIKKWISKQYEFCFSEKIRYEFVKDLPFEIQKNRILIVADGYQPDSLVFKCPCGCNSIIQLNLLVDAKPCWKYFITKSGNISVSPSINRRFGCKCHFFIREGRFISF